jgi:hypothetical protein
MGSGPAAREYNLLSVPCVTWSSRMIVLVERKQQIPRCARDDSALVLSMKNDRVVALLRDYQSSTAQAF